MASDSYLAQYESKLNDQAASGHRQIRLTQEEMRILRECNHESFLYRCLPFGVSAMAATYLAVKKGYLKSHPKYGPTFKMIGAGFLGWFFGKISYRNSCEDKFLRLPNSAVGDMIRKKRGYTPSELQKENSKTETEFIFPDEASILPDQNYDPSFGALNLDTDKNIQSEGLDDRDRPTTDSFDDFRREDIPKKTHITYEELRQRNRDAYEQQFRKTSSTETHSPRHSSSSRWDSFQDTFQSRKYIQDEGSKSSTNSEWDKE